MLVVVEQEEIHQLEQEELVVVDRELHLGKEIQVVLLLAEVVVAQEHPELVVPVVQVS
jgi:hypothetical protein